MDAPCSFEKEGVVQEISPEVMGDRTATSASAVLVAVLKVIYSGDGLDAMI